MPLRQLQPTRVVVISYERTLGALHPSRPDKATDSAATTCFSPDVIYPSSFAHNNTRRHNTSTSPIGIRIKPLDYTRKQIICARTHPDAPVSRLTLGHNARMLNAVVISRSKWGVDRLTVPFSSRRSKGRRRKCAPLFTIINDGPSILSVPCTDSFSRIIVVVLAVIIL